MAARSMALCSLLLSHGVDAVPGASASNPPFQPTWESLDARPNPEWYEQARFGIKIHWGPYAVPAFGALGQYAEQYARFYRVSTSECGTTENPISSGCKTAEFHNRGFGPDFKYDDFAAQFNPVLFNGSQWADVFRRGGAQYVYMTAKHSDGFAMWPSPVRHGFNSMDTIGRDLLGELMEGVEAAGLKKGIFYEFEDYFNFGCSYDVASPNPIPGKLNVGRRCPWGGSDEGFPAGWAAKYVASTLIPELRDLVTRYQPHYLYADGDWSGSDDFLQTKPFLAWLFNDSPVKDFVVVNDRWGNTTRTHHGGTFLCEYDPTCKFDHPFAVTQGFGKSFGYNRLETVHTGRWCDWNLQYGDGHCPVSRAVTEADTEECCTSTNTTGLVHLLVRTVSKGGNLEINFGPSGDGHLPAEMVQPLLGTGRWLETNGAAIYNSSGFPFGRGISECSSDTASAPVGSGVDAGEAAGPLAVDKCYTFRGTTVFVIYLHWPQVVANATAPASEAPATTPGLATAAATSCHSRLISLEHVTPTAQTTVQLLGSPSLASLPYTGGTAAATATRSGTKKPFEVVVPDRTPSDLRCELDLCHAFVFAITHVQLSS